MHPLECEFLWRCFHSNSRGQRGHKFYSFVQVYFISRFVTRSLLLFCNCRDSFKEYNEKVEKLAKQLMDVIIEGLEMNSVHFQHSIDKAFGLLRWNHYPPCPQLHKALEMSAHKDFNLLTVLHQGDIGGLQVQKDGN